MEDGAKVDLKNVLLELTTASLALNQLAAARELGKLSFSNEEIVRALAAAQVR